MMYFKETNVMFIGGIILALAVEFCNLHKRIALKVITIVGCSHRKYSIFGQKFHRKFNLIDICKPCID